MLNSEGGTASCRYLRCFTLIELLVVVGIISILVSALLPALNGALGRVRAISCMGNLKQIGKASQEYIEDYDGITMPGDFTGLSQYDHWVNYLYETGILNDERSFLCPSQTASDSFNPSGGANLITEASYIMNLMPRGSAGTKYWCGFGLTLDGQLQGWGRTTASLVREGDVRHPSRSLFIMDVAAGGIHWSHQGVNKSCRSDWGVPMAPPNGDKRWVGFHHMDGFNAVFGDMHAELKHQSDGENWVVKKN